MNFLRTKKVVIYEVRVFTACAPGPARSLALQRRCLGVLCHRIPAITGRRGCGKSQEGEFAPEIDKGKKNEGETQESRLEKA